MIVAIDVGGTNIRCSLVDVDTNKIFLLQTWSRKSGQGLATQEFLEIIQKYVIEVKKKNYRISGIGIALAGSVDQARRKVLIADNMKWYNVPLADLVEETTGFPTVIETDVICGLFGEVKLNVELAKKTIVYIAIGTGIGHGIMMSGRVLLGDTRSATRFGHLCIHVDGPKCYCGKNGCLCQYASGKGILERFNEISDFNVNETREIFELEGKGNRYAMKIVEQAQSALTIGLANIATLINPSVIIFAGGVISSNWPKTDHVLIELKKYITDDLMPDIRYGASPTTANLLGVAYIATSNKTEDLIL